MLVTKYTIPSFDSHKFTDAWEQYVCIIYTELNSNRTTNDASGLHSICFKRPDSFSIVQFTES